MTASLGLARAIRTRTPTERLAGSDFALSPYVDGMLNSRYPAYSDDRLQPFAVLLRAAMDIDSIQLVVHSSRRAIAFYGPDGWVVSDLEHPRERHASSLGRETCQQIREALQGDVEGGRRKPIPYLAPTLRNPRGVAYREAWPTITSANTYAATFTAWQQANTVMPTQYVDQP